MGSSRGHLVVVDGEEKFVPRVKTRKTKAGGAATKEKFEAEKEFNSMPFKPIGDAQELGAKYLKKVVKLFAYKVQPEVVNQS